MTGSRPARIWGLVAEQAARRGERVSAGDACVAAVAAVEVTGAWLVAASGAEPGHLMRVTDEVSELLAELQATLGEGPGPEAKGKLAGRLGLDMDQAFGLLRDYARTHNRRLSDLAQAFVAGSESLTGLNASKFRQRRPGDQQPRQQPRPGPGSRS